MLDAGYVEEHLEHAYALTGHGTQGGTVERAIVVGEPEDFSRNWGYTALSRARDTTHVMLIAQRATHAGREEIAPGEELDRSTEQTLDVLARRLRDPEEEDLALEQLERAADDLDVDVDHDRTPVIAVTQDPEAGAERNATDIAETATPGTTTGAVRDQMRRDQIDVADPLAAERRALGPDRAERMPALTDAGHRWLTGLPDTELAAIRDAHAHAPRRLDRAAAMQAKGADLAIQTSARARDQAAEEADRLRAQLAATGRVQRSKRQRLEQTIRAREASHAAHHHELDQHLTIHENLRAEGRHPDQWLEHHATDAVQSAAAEKELAVRRELALQDAAERAVTAPPEHVLELVGTRPAPGAGRDRWDELARGLERHRLATQLTVTQDVPLGPDLATAPPENASDAERDLGAYARERERLATRVREWRAEQRLEPHHAIPQATVALGPDSGLDR